MQLNLIRDPVIISSSLWGTVLGEKLDRDQDGYLGGEIMTLIHRRLGEEGFNVVLQPGGCDNPENKEPHESIIVPDDLEVTFSNALLLLATKTRITIIVEGNTVVMAIKNPDVTITRAPAER